MNNFDYYNKLINKNTIRKYDFTTVLQDYKSLNKLTKDLAKPFKNIKVDKVIGLESLGFIIGPLVAKELKCGFVPIRKLGKSPTKPNDKASIKFIDYSKNEKGFEINKSSIKKGNRLLIVDDWVETGSQVKAAIKLLEKLDAKIVGVTAFSSEENEKTNELFKKYNLHYVVSPD